MPSNNEVVLAEWAAKLQALLLEGARALERNDAATIRSVQQKLNRFPDESPAAADVLDRSAILAVIDLDAANTAEAAAKIRGRGDEVARLAKLIDAVADEAAGAADTLSLTSIKTALSSATSAISAFKDLKDHLTAKGTDPEIAADIEKIISAIQKLRNQIERI